MPKELARLPWAALDHPDAATPQSRPLTDSIARDADIDGMAVNRMSRTGGTNGFNAPSVLVAGRIMGAA